MAVKDFRKIITEKTKEEKEKNTVSVFSYAVPVCLAIAVLTVGMNFYRNFQNPEYPKDQSKNCVLCNYRRNYAITNPEDRKEISI